MGVKNKKSTDYTICLIVLFDKEIDPDVFGWQTKGAKFCDQFIKRR